MPVCSFCKRAYEPHEGLTYVKNDGKIIFLCSSKCRKNYHMGRRKVRWITKQE